MSSAARRPISAPSAEVRITYNINCLPTAIRSIFSVSVFSDSVRLEDIVKPTPKSRKLDFDFSNGLDSGRSSKTLPDKSKTPPEISKPVALLGDVAYARAGEVIGQHAGLALKTVKGNGVVVKQLAPFNWRCS